MDRTPDPGGDDRVDGRTARALRTRDRIVDACLELVEEGDVRPTAPKVAERADVSVRSVFQHFDDLDALYETVAGRLVERAAHLVAPIDPGLPLAERCRRQVDQRTALLEVITPYRRAANVHLPGSPRIAAMLQAAHDALTDEVAKTFAPELDLADRPEQLLDALGTALSWSVWEHLRVVEGRAAPEAEDVVHRMMTALLGLRL